VLHYTVLETLAKDKHSSLWGSFINNEVLQRPNYFCVYVLNGKVKNVNITLGGSTYLRLKLERFILPRTKNLNKTLQLTP